jgi:hypothetical protein
MFEMDDEPLDPNNPEHVLIAKQRAIREEWDAKLFEYRNKIADKPDDEFAIFTQNTLSLAGYFMHQFANNEFVGSSELAGQIQDALVDSYQDEGLYVDSHFASAIADPDQFNDEKRIASKGVLVLGRMAYDLWVPLLLNYQEHRKAFNLFFRIRLAHTELEDVNPFLAWHLENSFGSNIGEFNLYLKAVATQTKFDQTIPFNPGVLEVVEHWLLENLDNQVSNEIRSKATSANESALQSPEVEFGKSTNSDTEPPVTYKQLSNTLSKEKFGLIIEDCMKVLEIGRNKKILNQTDLESLKSIGLTLESPHAKVKLGLNRFEKGRLCRYFGSLYEALHDNCDCIKKIHLAEYLRSKFSDFDHSPRDLKGLTMTMKISSEYKPRIQKILK